MVNCPAQALIKLSLHSCRCSLQDTCEPLRLYGHTMINIIYEL